MALESYVLPQVKVFQQFRQISQDVVGNLNACIIGPHYQLARYNEASEKELTRLTGFTYRGEADFSPYPYNTKNVDESYVKVFFEKVVADYAELEDALVYDNTIFNQHVTQYRDLCGTGSPVAPTFVIDTNGILPAPHGTRFYYFGNRPEYDDVRWGVRDRDGNDVDTNRGFIFSDTGTPQYPTAIEAYDENDNLLFWLEAKPKYVMDYLDLLVQKPEVYKDRKFLGVCIGSENRIEYKDGCFRLILEAFDVSAAAGVLEGTPFSAYFDFYTTQVDVGTVAYYKLSNSETHDSVFVFSDMSVCGVYEIGDVTDFGVKVGDTFSYTVNGITETSTVASVAKYEVDFPNIRGVRLYGIKLLDAISNVEPLAHVNDYDVAHGIPLPGAKLSRLQSGSFEIPKKKPDGVSDNWDFSPSPNEPGILFYGGIQIETKNDADVSQILTVSSAVPFIEYRALQTQYADTVHTVRSTNDIQTMLGAIDMDNPLAQGCYHALLNSGQQPVYFIALKSDDQAGYDTALERLELTDDIYSLVPMTFDDAVLDDIQAHVKKMSGDEEKLWRIAVVGVSADKIVPVYNNAKHPLDHEYDAIVQDTDIGTLVTFEAEDETVATDDIWPGDKFYYNFDATNGPTVRTVKSVIDNTRITLLDKEEGDPDGTVYPTQAEMAKCEVWRNLTSAQWINYVADKISAFADRRMYAIFPEVLWNNGKKYPGYIGAAAIAGLISSVPPQQGLTRITLNGFDDIPMTYSSYTRTQLNHIAEYGGLIIMQDVPEGPVYVRHQVSTARKSEGNLLTTELSVTKNLDAISYYLAGLLDPYIGKCNVTPLFLAQLRTTIQSGLNYLGSYNTGAGLLGPMLLADSEDTKIVGIRQHETLKDHVIISLTLDLPLPCNVIELYLSV